MPEPEGFMIGALLNIPTYYVQRAVNVALAEAGFDDLGPSHQPVFGLLSRDGDRVTELAKRGRVTKQAMGYTIDHLEAHGYVERVPDPADGRASLVRRTEKGWQVNVIARQAVERIDAEWEAQLGTRKMAQLKALLRELTDMLGQRYEGSAAEHATGIARRRGGRRPQTH
jgi:DNA-binding MarR family transcriptional regulator